MAGIIITSHGDFAAGLLHSAEMICGKQEQVCVVSLLPQEGPEVLKEKLLAAIKELNEEEIVFLCDLWGGTPCNQANLLVAENEHYALFAGINLPLLMNAFMQKEQMDAKTLVAYLYEKSSNSMKCVPVQESKMVSSSTNVNQKENASGKMDVVLARVDSRLVHGQVVTSWVQAVHPNRIIVVSDQVAHDKLRKKLLEQAAPPGIYVNVVPVQKIIDVYEDVRFNSTRALLLFETIQDALRTIQGGVALDTLNIGSMAHKEGKVAVNKVLSLDMDDVDAFYELEKMNVTFDVRKVPNDAQEDMNAYLENASKQLEGKV